MALKKGEDGVGGGIMRQKTYEFCVKLRELSFPSYVSEVIVFGSEVYGIPRIKSDIDIAVACSSEPSTEDRVKLIKLLDDLSPPYEYHLCYFTDTPARTRFGVKHDALTKGIKLFVRETIREFNAKIN